MHVKEDYKVVGVLPRTAVKCHWSLWRVETESETESTSIRVLRNAFLTAILCFVARISYTRSQGYTDLQSLVNCLDARDILLDATRSQAKVVLGCTMHWIALESISRNWIYGLVEMPYSVHTHTFQALAIRIRQLYLHKRLVCRGTTKHFQSKLLRLRNAASIQDSADTTALSANTWSDSALFDIYDRSLHTRR